jgi:hypothetical protein
MKRLSPCHAVWLATGVFLGGTTRLALSADKPVPRTNPNVVVLRGEKVVSLESKDIRLADVAASFSTQTGYLFTLDKLYQDDKTSYHLLLSKAPLTRVLGAIAYMAHGKWERTRDGYHMRPLTPSERTSDVAQYEAAVEKAKDYLSQIDPNDPSLTKSQHARIQSWLDGTQMRQTDLAPFPLDTIGNWKVMSSDHGLRISYMEPSGEGSGSGVHWRTENWWWK